MWSEKLFAFSEAETKVQILSIKCQALVVNKIKSNRFEITERIIYW